MGFDSPSPSPLRVLFLIPSLERGGAERQSAQLAKAMSALGHVVHLVTFYPGGPFAAELEESGVILHSLDKRGRWDVLSLVRLRRIIEQTAVQVVYTWLSTGNLAGTVATLGEPGLRVVWSIRDAGALPSSLGVFPRAVMKLEAWASSLADLVIVNSQAGRAQAVRRGLPPSKLRVLHNGVDVQAFTPDPVARARLRAEWSIDPSAVVIGLVARLDPVKDHPTFLRAASLTLAARPDVRFVVIGDGDPRYLRSLQDLAVELRVDRQVRWAGARDDIPSVLSAFDVATLTSRLEAFPNSVAEAMAASLPCVVTDVGDCRLLVGDTGSVVAPAAPTSLAAAWLDLVTLSEAERRALGHRARQRVLQDYSNSRQVEDLVRTLGDLVSD